MESILTSTKKLLGIPEEYEVFDMDLIMHINAVFLILNQLNIGPEDCFMISDKEDKWEEFSTTKDIALVKSFVYLKVRMLFDPPTTGPLIDCINRTLSEIEWRLFLEGDS